MAVITTNNNAVGNVSDGTKFVGGFAPTTGDTLATNTASDITMDVTLDLGTSGASGTDAITMTGTSRLRFTSAPQVLRGGLTWNRGCRIDCAAGADIGWHMPAGSSYTFGTGTAGSGVQTLVTSGTSWSAPVTFRKLSGASGDTIRFLPDIFTAHVITLAYTRFEGFGSSSATAIACSGTSAAVNWSWTNVAMVGCGQFTCQLTSGSLTFNMNGFDIRSPLATTAINWTISTARTSGTRAITRLTAYDTSARIVNFTLRDFTVSDHRLYNTSYVATTSGHRDVTTRDGVQVWGLSAAQDMQTVRGGAGLLFERNVYAKILNDQNNGHNVMESGNAAVAQNIYQDSFFHGGFLAANDDDGVSPLGAATIRRNVFLGGFGGVNINTAAAVSVVHNTFIHDSLGGHGFGFILGELNASGVDTLVECSDNIFAVISAQNSGDMAQGFQIRGQSGTVDIPMNSGFLRNNAWWFNPSATASTRFNYWHTAQNRVSYVANAGASGGTVRLTSFTLASGTSYPTIKSSALFGSVVAGDMLFVPGKGNAQIASVTDSSTIVLDTATANFSSNPATGDGTCYIQKKLWATGQALGSDADHGGNDVYADPQFVDPSRSMATWDTSLGGSGSELDAVKQLVAVNGTAFDGTVTTPNTNYAPTALLTYFNDGVRPRNAALNAAYETVSTNGWIGAVEGIVSSGDHIRQQIPHLRRPAAPVRIPVGRRR